VFEGFTNAARGVVAAAVEEAQALRVEAVATGHLMLGVLRAVPVILPVRAEDLRARLGTGDTAPDASRPFTEAAQRALREATVAARRLGHAHVTPGHILMALSADSAIVTLTGLDPARLRDEALRHLIHPPERFELELALREGGPVPVWLGDRELPIGDLGHPRVDARLLLAMLGKNGRSAQLLREHGLDEAAVRGALGGP
jgi:ATP-dependent Clp protease ATP-binding subunit ClpA